jgi:hypothetical protein
MSHAPAFVLLLEKGVPGRSYQDTRELENDSHVGLYVTSIPPIMPDSVPNFGPDFGPNRPFQRCPPSCILPYA